MKTIIKLKKSKKNEYHDIEIPIEFIDYFEENFQIDMESLQDLIKNFEFFGEKKKT